MASLRARLVAGLLALSAVGLLTLAGITYAVQRSFLLDRADQQLRAAPGAIARALDDDHGFGFEGDARGGPPPGADPDVGLPPGTWGERRDADGTTSKRVVLDYGQNVTSRPAIPARLEPGRIVTVSGRAGDGTRYRVMASPDREGSGVIIAAVPLREADQILHRLLLVESLVIAGILLGLGLIARLLVRMGLLPLDRMAHTAGAIAGGDLSHRVPSTDPRTEVGRLGRALNAMLDRLEDAFAERQASEDRLRQFLADASHELRTPLTTIRGYAELYRIGAARDSGETERAMRRIEEEAARMGVLVEDLLTLARLDEVRAAPHVPVDLAALAGDAVDDARATAPERPIDLSVAPPATVLGDADQLRQVLGNLIRNALVHTPTGTAIEVGLTPRNGTVELAVRDHGGGLPAEDPDALFGRFWRAERGRERGRGGAGLGLAIVAAVVEAHGGTATAANAPGGGALFAVRLPAA
jgi:two-component system OmpR family sensor kinase